jgi:hypothetical protein
MFKTLHKVNWYSDVVVGNDEPSKGDKNQQSKDIRGKVSKHILQQLAVINLKLDGIFHQSSNVGLEPSWVTCSGTVSGHKHVVMDGLIPTLHCIEIIFVSRNMFKTLHKVNWYSDVVVGNDEPSKGDKIRNCLVK